MSPKFRHPVAKRKAKESGWTAYLRSEVSRIRKDIRLARKNKEFVRADELETMLTATKKELRDLE